MDNENKSQEQEMGVYPEQLLRRRRTRVSPFGPIGSYPVPNFRPGSWGTGYTPSPGLLGSDFEDWVAINEDEAEELAISPREGHWLSGIEPDLLLKRGKRHRARRPVTGTGDSHVLRVLFD